MTGNKKMDMEFCKKLISEHTDIVEIMGINREKRWYHCPFCGKSLFPIRTNTKIQHMPFRCKACKHDIEVNI